MNQVTNLLVSDLRGAATLNREHQLSPSQCFMVAELLDQAPSPAGDEAMQAEISRLRQAIEDANWKLSGFVDAGGGTKSLKEWCDAITEDRSRRYAVLAASPAVIGSEREAIAAFVERTRDVWGKNLADLIRAGKHTEGA